MYLGAFFCFQLEEEAAVMAVSEAAAAVEVARKEAGVVISSWR